MQREKGKLTCKEGQEHNIREGWDAMGDERVYHLSATLQGPFITTHKSMGQVHSSADQNRAWLILADVFWAWVGNSSGGGWVPFTCPTLQ